MSFACSGSWRWFPNTGASCIRTPGPTLSHGNPIPFGFLPTLLLCIILIHFRVPFYLLSVFSISFWSSLPEFPADGSNIWCTVYFLSAPHPVLSSLGSHWTDSRPHYPASPLGETSLSHSSFWWCINVIPCSLSPQWLCSFCPFHWFSLKYL